MPTRPDLRDISANVKEAFADADRETLLEVLTFVIKEYVVEGPPPMLVHQVENLSDLANLSFAQLVTALQTRLDHAELGLFAVDGEQVSVRIGGVMQPLMPSRAGAPAAAELPRPAAGVRVVETNVTRQAPAAAPAASGQTARHSAPPPAAASGAAPPPSRGLSMRGRPTGEGAAPEGEAPAAPAPTPAPPAAAPAAAPEKKEGSGDDASARFSLLELD
jgi:hypothetical protein